MSIEQRQQGTHPTTGARYYDWTQTMRNGLVREHRCVEVISAKHVNQDVLNAAQEVEESWFGNVAKIEWDEFWDRLDGTQIATYEEREIDLGNDTDTPAMRKIQKHIRTLRRMG